MGKRGVWVRLLAHAWLSWSVTFQALTVEDETGDVDSDWNGRVCFGDTTVVESKVGAKIGRASKAGCLGEVSLKSTLSVLTMAGSLALFNTIESALAPDDVVGRAWLEQEKAEYMEQMWPWFKKPWTWSGIIVMVLIMTVGGGLGFRSKRSKRKVQEERRMRGWMRRWDTECRSGRG